jgi:hypothetical protein
VRAIGGGAVVVTAAVIAEVPVPVVAADVDGDPEVVRL